MSRIIIDGNELDRRIEQNVVKKEISISDDVYLEQCVIERVVTSQIYKYDDLKLVISEEMLFNQIHHKVVVYDREKTYEMITLPEILDMYIYRIDVKQFIVIAINKDKEVLGQISFCTLMDSGRVTEKQMSFDELKQYLFIDKYLLTNTIEKLENEKTNKIQYINSLTLYNLNGTIKKYLYENKTESLDSVEFRLINNTIFIVDNAKGVISALRIVDGEIIEYDTSSQD